jgi:hypothetical protein
MTEKNRSKEPYRVLLSTPMPRNLDRRVVLTEGLKDRIKEMHAGGMGLCAIARELEGVCSKRAVHYIIKPDTYPKMLAKAKELHADGRYKVSKKKHADNMRVYRRRKVALLGKGKGV